MLPTLDFNLIFHGAYHDRVPTLDVESLLGDKGGLSRFSGIRWAQVTEDQSRHVSMNDIFSWSGMLSMSVAPQGTPSFSG